MDGQREKERRAEDGEVERDHCPQIYLRAERERSVIDPTRALQSSP